LILGSLGVSVTVVGAVQAVLPVLAIAMSRADWSESGAAFLGLMFTVIGVGALVGSLAFGLVPTAPSLRVSMTASVLLSLAVVVASLVEARILFLATLGAYGFLGSVAVTLLNGHLQRATNDAFRARVMSLFVAVYAIATAVGSLVGGIAADLLPAHAALTFIGTAGAGVGLLLVLRARTRGTAEGLVPTS
jgi:predicted MFS family arabinose efflux permease